MFDISKKLLSFDCSVKPVILYTVRIMFKFVDKDCVNFKIITDTIDGINKFINDLCCIDNVSSVAFEYLFEYNCSKLGFLNEIYKKDGDSDEKI